MGHPFVKDPGPGFTYSVLATGMTDGMEASYARLERVLVG